MTEEAMSKEEFQRRMETIFDTGDIEDAHSKADDLMCELLRSLGYGGGAGVFERADKWYA